MNKYQLMFPASLILMATGFFLGIYGFLAENWFFCVGVGLLISGLLLLGSWITKAHTYICKDCYMRIDVGVAEALLTKPAGSGCRRIYCPKCHHKTVCKSRRISLRRYVF